MIKSALQLLKNKDPTPPPTPRARARAIQLAINTGSSPNELLIKSLKTTFENIPWRFEDDDLNPIISSAASWGSPMFTDATLNNATRPGNPPQRPGETPTSAIQRRQYLLQPGQHPAPPPAYAQSPELVWQRLLSHAMDEIHELQREVTVLKSDVSGSNRSLQTKLSSIKTMMNSVLRKETFTLANKSVSMGVQDISSSTALPREGAFPPVVVENHPIGTEEMSRLGQSTPKTMISNLPSPGLSSPGTLSPGMHLAGMSSPSFSMYGENGMVIVPPAPPRSHALLKFTASMVSAHMLALFIPNMILRIFVLGCVTDVCMLAFASPHLPSSAAYLLSFGALRVRKYDGVGSRTRLRPSTVRTHFLAVW